MAGSGRNPLVPCYNNFFNKNAEKTPNRIDFCSLLPKTAKITVFL
jgi:hypothetical protein